MFRSDPFIGKGYDSSVKAAAVTLRCSSNPSVNLSNIAETVSRVTQDFPGTDLVVFGEMVTGLYNPGEMAEYHRSISLPLNEGTLSRVMNAARDNRIHVCFGFSELSENTMYNSQVLIDNLGQIKAVHRKRNLKQAETEAGYMPGEIPVTFTEINGLRTAMVICSDAASLSVINILMKSSQDLVILSLADDRDENWFMARCNAHLYDSWIITANRYGREGSLYWDGHTVISDPRGHIVSRSSGREAVLSEDIEPFKPLSFFCKLKKRAAVPFIVLGNLKSLRSYF